MYPFCCIRITLSGINAVIHIYNPFSVQPYLFNSTVSRTYPHSGISGGHVSFEKSNGGQCAMAYKLDGDPEQGMVSVALTSIAVHGQGGEIYEPVGRGLRMVSFALRDGDGRLIRQQKAAPTRCPKNGHERFGVKLPKSVSRDDVSVQLFAPAYEKTFGSVAGTFPEKRR